MTDSIPWLKALQSKSRGFRPGMEITVLKSRQAGKTITVDFESDDFKPWRETFRPHYAEYSDCETGETYWKTFSRHPKAGDMYMANMIVRKNEDGSYEYVKNRETGELRKLNEEETTWLILKV